MGLRWGGAFVGCGGKHIVGGVERWVGMDGVFWIGWRDRNARWKGVCGRRRPTQSKGWITWRIEVGVAAVRKPVACAFASIGLEGLPEGFGGGEPVVGFGFRALFERQGRHLLGYRGQVGSCEGMGSLLP